MHFIVSWDINAEGEKWDALNAQLKECIEDYSWARPLQSSALFSILVGIAVAMIQSGWSSALGVFGFVFFVWFGFSLVCAYKKP